MRHFTKILTFQPSRLLENGFPTLKREANSSWKYIKMKLTLKKYENLFTLQIFFFVHAACTAILSWNWRNNKTMFSVSKIQAWENLIIQLQPCPQGSFLLQLDSTCLNDGIVIKIKKPFTLSFLFKKPFFIFVTDDSVQIWRSKLQYQLHLKSLVQLLICNFFLLSCSWKKKVVLYI